MKYSVLKDKSHLSRVDYIMKLIHEYGKRVGGNFIYQFPIRSKSVHIIVDKLHFKTHGRRMLFTKNLNQDMLSIYDKTNYSIKEIE